MKEIRINLLAVTAMGVILCIFAFYKLGDADKVALIVSGFIGAIGATLIQLVKPPPPEEEPAPEAQVPVSGVVEIIKAVGEVNGRTVDAILREVENDRPQ